MPNTHHRQVKCALCSHHRPLTLSLPAAALRHSLATYIEQTRPANWDARGYICRTCLDEARTAYVMEQLEQERGALSAVEAEVSKKATEHSTIAAHLEEQFRRDATFGQRLADAVAKVGGSWPFVIGFCALLAVWIAVNSVALAADPFDPYPYILLNLLLSCLAAIQAPVIMMSQNRAAARDRLEADEDYKVNLKAELEIAALHEKVDHLLHVQWERMVEIQQTQLELLTELTERKR